MNIWAAIICVSVSLIRTVNSEYCDEKKSSEDIWQLISNFDPRNASKPSKGCSKHIDNFQKSLTYATGKTDAYFEHNGDSENLYRCDTKLMSEVFWECRDNVICFCHKSTKKPCEQILLTYHENNKSGSVTDYLKPIMEDVMKCNTYPPEKLAEAEYPWPLLPPMSGLKNGAGFQGAQYLPYSILYLVGVIYTFFALAIVCDEYFVPALTRMCHKMQISDDVAGATLMAAGGSAPELFTAFIGTFKQDEVGFGTIVGSAVFNVLLVIGMCTFFSKEALQLTWWPLFRDATYYCICLLVLALLFGVISPMEIQWYESLILLVLYGGYVLLMGFNQKLEKLIAKATANCQKKAKRVKPVQKDRDEVYELNELNTKIPGAKRNRAGSIVVVVKAKKLTKTTFLTPYTFRAGILQLGLGLQKRNKAGWYLVTQVEGDVEDTFNSVDTNRDNKIDREEMKKLLNKLGHQPTESEVDSVFNNIDADKDGAINQKEFWRFYKQSSERLLSEVKVSFDELDMNKDGVLKEGELIKLLTNIGVTPVEKAEEMVNQLHDGDNLINGMDQLHFTEWIKTQTFWQERVKEHGEKHADKTDSKDDDDDGLQLKWPKDKGFRVKLIYIITLPLLVVLYYTIPDTRKEYWKNYFVLSFVLSIAWIAVFSVFMVWFATILGDIFGISTAVMGLTVLSAGTSIPDLLSSVIVARQGHGNMAVSSSIGSNLFDILVGLPLPWLVYSIYRGISATVSGGCLRYLYDKDGRFTIVSPKQAAIYGVGANLKLPNIECYLTEVFADTLFFSLILLLSMIVLFIIVIAIFKWKLTKGLGALLVVLYFIFLAQDLLRNEDISGDYIANTLFKWTQF